jgi:hypothetical protein
MPFAVPLALCYGEITSNSFSNLLPQLINIQLVTLFNKSRPVW